MAVATTTVGITKATTDNASMVPRIRNRNRASTQQPGRAITITHIVDRRACQTVNQTTPSIAGSVNEVAETAAVSAPWKAVTISVTTG